MEPANRVLPRRSRAKVVNKRRMMESRKLKEKTALTIEVTEIRVTLASGKKIELTMAEAHKLLKELQEVLPCRRGRQLDR